MSIRLDTTDGPLNNGVAAAQGSVAIGSGVQSISPTFTMALLNTNYALVFSIMNLIDAQPIFLQGIITAFSITGFTVSFNAPTDSANYVLSYIVVRNA